MKRGAVLRLERPELSTRVDLRALWVLAALALAILAAVVTGLSIGDYPIGPVEVAKAIFGEGSEGAEFVVFGLRLPRVLAALLVGAALALSGAIFQALAQNPLVAPDIIGVNSGAALAAVAVIVLGGPFALLAPAAFAGALAAAVAIYLLAWRRGVSRYRLVLVGIGLNAVLWAGISYLLTRAEIWEVQRAYVWLVGSVYGSDWQEVGLIAAGLAVLVPGTLALARPLGALQLGDEVARALGTRVEGARLGLVVCAVALAALAVTVGGPVGFVAFVAPHIARRLVRAPGGAVLPTALAAGALLVLAADLVAQRAFAPASLPVGILTALVGAPYFLYLLTRANRLGRTVQ
jgi:iron complex transport system permease protein